MSQKRTSGAEERPTEQPLARSRAFLIGFAIAAGVAMGLVPLHFIMKLGIDVPVWEHWDFLPVLDASYAGRPWLGSLFKPFFGHMVAVPMLLFIGFSRLTGWDLMFEMYWGWVIVVATCLLLARWIRELRLPLPLKVLLFLCLALLVFGLRASELTLNGLNSGVFLSYLLIVATLDLAREPRGSWPRVLAAAGVGLLATWSWGAGILVWPAGALLLLHHERARWGKLALWSLSALGALSPFFLFRVKEAVDAAQHDLTRIPGWFLGVVSSPFSLKVRVLPAVLLLALAAAAVGVLGWRALRARRLPPEVLPWAALLAHGLLTILLILYVRSPRPDFSAAHSRYTYVAALFIAGILPLGLLALREVTEGASATVRRAAWAAASVVLLLIGGRSAYMSYQVYELVTGWHPQRGALEAFLRRAPQHATSGQFLYIVQGRLDLVEQGLAIMKRWHLGPYRWTTDAAAPVPLSAWVKEGQQAEEVELAITSSQSLGNGDLLVHGWTLDRRVSRPTAFLVAAAGGNIVELALTEMEAHPPPPGADARRNLYGWRLLLPAEKLRALPPPGKLELVAVSSDGRTRRIPLPLPEAQRVAADSPEE